MRALSKPGSTEEDQNFFCAQDFSEELEVAKKLPSDPTVPFWLPSAPPKSPVHTNRTREKSMTQFQVSGLRGADLWRQVAVDSTWRARLLVVLPFAGQPCGKASTDR